MIKRDRIFYGACCLSLIGAVLVVMGYDLAMLFFVAAYLLRPALHEFGATKQYADERQLTVHSRSGNLAFIIVILAAVGLMLLRISRGELGEEFYELIFIGLAVRALSGLIMNGEYRKAGSVIIGAIGVFLGAFVMLDAGLSLGSLFGLVIAAVFIGLAYLARKFPRVMGSIAILIALGAIFWLDLYDFKRASTALWLFMVAPLATAAACLFLGSGEEEAVSNRTRARVFGSLGAGAAIIFTLVIIFSEKGSETASGASNVRPGEVVEIQGVTCIGHVEYYQDGTLESCTLAREDTLSGQPLAEGTVVHFAPNGIMDWCFLQEETEIQGHLCRGEGHSWTTGFHPNGQLRLIWLARDEVIHGVPCSAASFRTEFLGASAAVYLYDDGQLKQCMLSDEFTIDGQQYEKGAQLKFDRNGKLIQGS